MQRDFQARFYFRTGGNYVIWPPNREGEPAPLYPPDGFYGTFNDDPLFASYLVGDLCNQFYGYYFELYFIDDGDSGIMDRFNFNNDFPLFYGFMNRDVDPEGATYAEYSAMHIFYTDPDFPITGPGYDLMNVNPTNWAACQQQLSFYLSRLVKTTGEYGGLTGVSTNVDISDQGGGTTDPPAVDCGPAKDNARGHFGWGLWYGNVPIGVATGTQKWLDGTGYVHYAESFARRGRAYSGPTFIPGTIKVYGNASLWGTSEAVGPEPPPFAVDNRYHAFWTERTDTLVEKLGTTLADVNPLIGGTCPTNMDGFGWQLNDSTAVFYPDFSSIARSGPRPPGPGSGHPNDKPPIDPPPCASCQSGNCNTPGSVTASSDGVDVWISMGPDQYGKSAGALSIRADRPSNRLYTLANLRFAALSRTGGSITVLNTNGIVDQFETANVTVYFHSNSASCYSILFTNENVSPHKFMSSVTISNNANINQMFITEIIGPNGSPRIIRYDFNEATTNWAKVEGNGVVNESRTIVWTSLSNCTDTIILSNSVGTAALQTVKKYRRFDWGDSLVEQTVGTGGSARTTTYTYYENATDTNTFGQLKQIVEPGGRWERFDYGPLGRMTIRANQFLDSAVDSTNALNRVIQFSYDPTNLVTTNIEKLLDIEISRTYYVQCPPTNDIQMMYTIRCAVGGAGINHAANLTNISWRTTSEAVTGTIWETIKEFHPDGTMTFYTNRTAYPSAGQKTTIVKTGAPNGNKDDIVEGTKTVTVVGAWGQMLTNEVYDIASGLLVDRQIYVYSDDLNRSYTVTYLDGTTEIMSYACCGLDSQTDREAVTTQYIYDAARRQVATTRLGITTTNVLDAAGHVLKTIRIGTDNSQIRLSSATFNSDGSVFAQTNALDGVTLHYRGTNGSGYVVYTNIHSDGSTSITTLHKDGSTLSLSGSAVHPMQYLYGVDADGAFTTEVKVASDGGTNEWVKTCTDPLGRSYKTVFAAASGPYPYSLSTYNLKGQLTNQIDPDGVVTLFAYDGKGEQLYSAVDSNRNYAIDSSGTDRITFTTNDVLANHGTTVRRSRTYLWRTMNSAVSNLASTVEVSIDGLHVWQTQYRDASTPVISENQTVYSGTNRFVTNTAANGARLVQTFQGGRLTSAKFLDSQTPPATVLLTSCTYDAHGRRATITDSRNGTGTTSYNNAGLVTSTTTPNPGTVGGAPQTTQVYYNNRGQATNVINADGTSVTTEYYPTGEIKRRYGSRTTPVGYGYDSTGRIKTMTNWTSFPSTGARVTAWNYDLYRGWLTNKTYEGNVTGPSYNYTAAGRLATRTWARGVTTSYSFDGAGQQSTMTYSDSTPGITNSYDRLGRAASIFHNSTITTLAYNDADQPLSEAYSGGTLNGLIVTNGYDAYLRRTVMTLSNQPTTLIQFGYDSAGRLGGVTNGNCEADYSYIANSPLVGQITFKSNNVTRMTTTKQFDHLNRLTSISSVPSGSSEVSFNYSYNAANQRTVARFADDSFWRYDYDTLGQVTSGKKFWSDWTPVAGQQFEYAYDNIGNRTSTKSGGDENAAGLRSANYSASALNQYTNRDVQGYIDIMGVSFATNAVTVNSQSAYRHGEYFRKELPVNNGSSALWTNVIVAATGQTSVTGNVFVAKTAETFGYDPDGNMTNDGRWALSWDAENRLTQIESLSTGPQASKRKVVWQFDSRGRRIRQTTYDGSSGSYVATEDLKFISDGWRHVAELNATNNALVRSYVWGLDMSGSLDGAGGIGGLLMLNSAASGVHFYGYDGNGNVSVLGKASAGTASANYEYDPFGRTLRATGLAANENSFRFSTKRLEISSDFALYEMRTYSPSLGTFLSRDPAEERAGNNLSSFVANNPINKLDLLGKEIICYCPEAYFSSLGLEKGVHYKRATTSYPKYVALVRPADDAENSVLYDSALEGTRLDTLIILRMLQSRNTAFVADDLEVRKLQAHVNARKTIVKNALGTVLNFGPANISYSERDDDWRNNPEQFFLDRNKPQNSLYCGDATYLVFQTGNRFSGPGGRGDLRENDPIWIPGDGGYVRNLRYRPPSDPKSGENVIHLDYFMNTDYFWGHYNQVSHDPHPKDFWTKLVYDMDKVGAEWSSTKGYPHYGLMDHFY